VSIDGSDLLRAGGPGAIETPRGAGPFSLWAEGPHYARAVIVLESSGNSLSDARKGVVVQTKNGPSGSSPNDKFDDEDFPAYSMGSAASILGTTPAFLRSLDEANLLSPQRSEGGHRRYSRYQLRIAARARELVDRGTALDAACRIIILEDQLAEAHAMNAELHRSLNDRAAPSGEDPQS
jgi:DNA-binding transcriptional MerR regulator